MAQDSQHKSQNSKNASRFYHCNFKNAWKCIPGVPYHKEQNPTKKAGLSIWEQPKESDDPHEKNDAIIYIFEDDDIAISESGL